MCDLTHKKAAEKRWCVNGAKLFQTISKQIQARISRGFLFDDFCCCCCCNFSHTQVIETERVEEGKKKHNTDDVVLTESMI